jgi:hypothetical protein
VHEKTSVLDVDSVLRMPLGKIKSEVIKPPKIIFNVPILFLFLEGNEKTRKQFISKHNDKKLRCSSFNYFPNIDQAFFSFFLINIYIYTIGP